MRTAIAAMVATVALQAVGIAAGELMSGTLSKAPVTEHRDILPIPDYTYGNSSV